MVLFPTAGVCEVFHFKDLGAQHPYTHRKLRLHLIPQKYRAGTMGGRHPELLIKRNYKAILLIQAQLCRKFLM